MTNRVLRCATSSNLKPTMRISLQAFFRLGRAVHRVRILPKWTNLGYAVSLLKEEVFSPIDGVGVRLPSFQNYWSDSENITRLECTTFDQYNSFAYWTTIVRGSKIPEQETEEKKNGRHRVIYARVSSAKLRENLECQVAVLRAELPQHQVVRDVSSEMNWSRPGLRTVLWYCLEGSLRELMVAHRDRLSKLAFGLLEYLIAEAGGQLVVRFGRDFREWRTRRGPVQQSSRIFVPTIRSPKIRKQTRSLPRKNRKRPRIFQQEWPSFGEERFRSSSQRSKMRISVSVWEFTAVSTTTVWA